MARTGENLDMLAHILEGQREDGRDREADASSEEQAAASLGDGLAEVGLLAAHAGCPEAEPQAQQQVGQDGTEDGGLDDLLVPLLDCQDQKQDDLDDRAKGSLDEDAGDGGHLAAKLLAREADEVRAGDHGDVGEDEDGEVLVAGGVPDGDGGGDDGPQDVDGAGGLARGPPRDAEELGAEPPAAALAGGLDVGGQGRVAIAVVVPVADGLVPGQGRVARAGLFCGGHVVAPRGRRLAWLWSSQHVAGPLWDVWARGEGGLILIGMG